MNLKQIKANMTELTVGDKTVLFSYSTPVAYHEAGIGYAKTNKYWSRTTSKHITQWLAMNGFSAERGDGLREVEQSQLDNLINSVNSHEDLVYACRLALSDGAIENQEVLDFLRQTIVQAVNSHEDLIGMLKWSLEIIKQKAGEMPVAYKNSARDLIAKAEGK